MADPAQDPGPGEIVAVGALGIVVLVIFVGLMANLL